MLSSAFTDLQSLLFVARTIRKIPNNKRHKYLFGFRNRPMEPEQETEPTPTPKIILKTGANVNVTFSSDEEGPGGLSSIQEEESSEAPKPPTQSQPTQSQPTPLKFSMPIPKQEEEPVAMDFESALGMLKKNKELKKGRFQKYSRFD